MNTKCHLIFCRSTPSSGQNLGDPVVKWPGSHQIQCVYVAMDPFPPSFVLVQLWIKQENNIHEENPKREKMWSGPCILYSLVSKGFDTVKDQYVKIHFGCSEFVVSSRSDGC